jgi:hypothetical protein
MDALALSSVCSDHPHSQSQPLSISEDLICHLLEKFYPPDQCLAIFPPAFKAALFKTFQKCSESSSKAHGKKLFLVFSKSRKTDTKKNSVIVLDGFKTKITQIYNIVHNVAQPWQVASHNTNVDQQEKISSLAYM